MPTLTPVDSAPFPARSELLRWLYLGRVTLVSGILVGALLVPDLPPGTKSTAVIMFAVALAMTGVSFWRTHLSVRDPSENFLYVQVVLDALLVTGIVHITQGDQGSFAPLYILVIAAGALLLPFRGGVLIGIFASALYFADVALFHQPEGVTLALGLQMGLFTVVAIVTGLLGDRLRTADLRLGAVESELERLRLDTSEILDNLSTGILTVDQAGRLAYVNPAGAGMLGLDPDQWLGAPVLSTVEGVAPGLGTLLRRSIAERAPVVRFKTRAEAWGTARILGVSTTVIDPGEKGQLSATAIFQDITDLERVDALDRRNQRLEAVAELSASLAHEIKNPLASIRSSVEQMSIGQLDERDEQQLRRLVMKESDRLSRLLSEFLEFSGLRLGRLADLDLRAITRDAVQLVRAHPDASSGVTFVCDGLDEPLAVRGDEDLLHRAVYNLVLNAAQFAGETGTVRVVVGPPEVIPAEAAHIPDPVRIAVEDSGPGFDETATDRLFDPFYTTRRGGSGLGLAVVHRAVEAHDGAVLAANRAVGGAIFALYVPRGGKEDDR